MKEKLTEARAAGGDAGVGGGADAGADAGAGGGADLTIERNAGRGEGRRCSATGQSVGRKKKQEKVLTR